MTYEDLTQVQSDYLDWRADPHRKGNKVDWGKTHGVTADTLRVWEKSPSWTAAFEQRCRELNVSHDRVQDVINAAYEKAINGDVQAMKLYMAHVERINPTKPTEPKGIEDLSDEELDELAGKVLEDAE